VDEQAQVVGVRRRRSRAEAQQLVAEYEASGLSRAEFCRERQLSLATLARYRQRQSQSQAAPGTRWLAVEVSGVGPRLETGTSSGLVVALAGGRRIEVGRGFDGRTLGELVGLLERI
jgi:hypothetical protein